LFKLAGSVNVSYGESILESR